MPKKKILKSKKSLPEQSKVNREKVIIFAIGMLIILAGFFIFQNRACAGERVIASTYWEDKWVATGKRFNRDLMAVAHKFLPFGTHLTLYRGHRSAVVVVNDRGPYIRGRTLDLTPAVNKQLQCGGLCRVRMESWPPLPKPRPYIPEPVMAWGEEHER